jgi:hypothetical protein
LAVISDSSSGYHSDSWTRDALFLDGVERKVSTENLISADIAKVQEDLDHANVSTTRLYDCRKSRPEDPATLKISY